MDNNWNGIERRKCLNQCDSHLDMVKSVAVIETTIIGLDKRINGSLLSIEKHMDQGIQWRIAIIGTAVALLLQLFGVIFFISKQAKQLEVNTERIAIMEGINSRFLAFEGHVRSEEEHVAKLELELTNLQESVNLHHGEARSLLQRIELLEKKVR